MSDIQLCFATRSFKTTEKPTTCLPDPSGLLFRDVPSSAIRQANKEVEVTLEKKSKQRGPYQTHALTQDLKLQVAKYICNYKWHCCSHPCL